MKLAVSLVMSISLLIIGVSQSHAIPAFTRANNVECSTCHTIFPELNEYGEAFLKNGYVYFGKGKKKSTEKVKAAAVVEKTAAAPVTVAPVVNGDGDADLLSKLKSGMMALTDAPAVATPSQQNAETDAGHSSAPIEAKPEGILLSGIPEQLPISFTGNLHGTYNKSAINEFDFSTRTLKLNAGGHFKEKAAFFATYVLYTEDVDPTVNTSNTPTNMNGKNDIGEMFAIWRHAFDTPLNIKIGRFQPKLSLWKANNKLSISNPYATTSYTVGNQSVFRLEQPQDAIEANMIIAKRIFVATGAVNRKNQNTKEWYAHTSVKFGGADYLANEPEIDLNKDESILDFLTVTLGGYGYVGTNGDPNTTAGVRLRQNEYYRAGVDADILYKLFRLKLAAVLGSDNNVDLTYSLPEEITRVAVMEGQYAILQNLIGALRFEYQDDGSKTVRRFIPTVVYAPIENFKIAAEYKHEYGTEHKLAGDAEVLNKIGTLGVTLSF